MRLPVRETGGTRLATSEVGGGSLSFQSIIKNSFILFMMLMLAAFGPCGKKPKKGGGPPEDQQNSGEGGGGSPPPPPAPPGGHDVPAAPAPPPAPGPSTGPTTPPPPPPALPEGMARTCDPSPSTGELTSEPKDFLTKLRRAARSGGTFPVLSEIESFDEAKARTALTCLVHYSKPPAGSNAFAGVDAFKIEEMTAELLRKAGTDAWKLTDGAARPFPVFLHAVNGGNLNILTGWLASAPKPRVLSENLDPGASDTDPRRNENALHKAVRMANLQMVTLLFETGAAGNIAQLDLQNVGQMNVLGLASNELNSPTPPVRPATEPTPFANRLAVFEYLLGKVREAADTGDAAKKTLAAQIVNRPVGPAGAGLTVFQGVSQALRSGRIPEPKAVELGATVARVGNPTGIVDPAAHPVLRPFFTTSAPVGLNALHVFFAQKVRDELARQRTTTEIPRLEAEITTMNSRMTVTSNLRPVEQTYFDKVKAVDQKFEDLKTGTVLTAASALTVPPLGGEPTDTAEALLALGKDALLARLRAILRDKCPTPTTERPDSTDCGTLRTKLLAYDSAVRDVVAAAVDLTRLVPLGRPDAIVARGREIDRLTAVRSSMPKIVERAGRIKASPGATGLRDMEAVHAAASILFDSFKTMEAGFAALANATTVPALRDSINAKLPLIEAEAAQVNALLNRTEPLATTEEIERLTAAVRGRLDPLLRHLTAGGLVVTLTAAGGARTPTTDLPAPSPRIVPR